MLIFPLFIGCKKEPKNDGEALEQWHILNFVNKSGTNLFESNQIPPSEFRYVTESWDDIKIGKEHYISYLERSHFPDADTVVDILEKNEYLIIENFQGERIRDIFINGVQYTLKLAPLREGVFLNNKALEFSTDKFEGRTFYVHHIVLEGF